VRKFQGAKVPHLELSLPGANGLGSEKSSSRGFWFIHGFYVSISIQKILKGSLQPKLKVAIVWPLNARSKVPAGWISDIWSLYRYCKEKNRSMSTAVISRTSFTCPGRGGPGWFLGLTISMGVMHENQPVTVWESIYLSIPVMHRAQTDLTEHCRAWGPATVQK